MGLLKISVVIPSYNQGDFIEKSIKSILLQQYDNTEIIIMDGGSSDETLSILKKYDQEIAYWVSKPDNGQSDALVKGFAIATGEILCWLNSDDVFCDGAFHCVNRIFQERTPDIVYGNRQIIDENGQIVGQRYLTPFLPTLIRDAFFCGGFGIYQPSAFWTARMYREVGGLDPTLKFCMDNDLLYKFILHGAQAVYLNAFITNFRVHAASKTSTLQETADNERAMLYRKYVLEKQVQYPRVKKILARMYRVFWLVAQKQLMAVIKNKMSKEFGNIP